MRQIPPIHPIEAEAWKSCFILPDHAREELVGTRKQCMEVMDDFEQEEERLRNQLQKIASEKATLASRVQKLESALAPHKQLPPEVLARIFEFTRDDTLHLPTDTGIIKFKPIRVVHSCRPQDVCSFWRQVALRTPAIQKDACEGIFISYRRIWDRVYFSDQAQYVDAILEFAGYVRNLINNGSRSLEIHFWGRQRKSDDEPDEGMIFRGMIGDNLPQLEELTIVNQDVTQEFMEACVDLLPTFPRLRSVYFDFQSKEGQFLPLPRSTMHSLIELKIEESLISIRCFHQLLACSPLLQSCYVVVSCEDHLPLASEDPTCMIVHKSLSYLYIDYFYVKPPPSDIMAPLYAVNLPSLRELKFQTDHCPPGNTLQKLPEFIRRSQCHLEKLSFRCPYGSRDDIIPEWNDLIATCLSSLKRLQVPWVFTPEILQKIACGEFLPVIVSLDCVVLESAKCQWCQAIEKLVESRCMESGAGSSEGRAYFQQSMSL